MDVMESAMEHREKGIRFDTTINIPTIIMVASLVAGAVVFGVSQYNGVTSRVQTLENAVGPNNDRFDRIERAINDQKGDTKSQLGQISMDLKDTNVKLDALHDQLLLSSVGNRPDIKRWAK